MTRLLSTKEAADALGVDRVTIYRNCKAGRLQAIRIRVRGEYRIAVEDLQEFARKYTYPCDLPEDAESD